MIELIINYMKGIEMAKETKIGSKVFKTKAELKKYLQEQVYKVRKDVPLEGLHLKVADYVFNKGVIVFKNFVVTSLLVVSTAAHACDWEGIPEVRSGRYSDQAIAMCQTIPVCREKYEVNEQCKKDWYEQRKKGNPLIIKKRDRKEEYEAIREHLDGVTLLRPHG